MQYQAFYVGSRPKVYWDPELAHKNQKFLAGIDPTYYRHVMEAHAPHLEGDSKLQAATALRIAYSQGLETLFALLCALVQAPGCVVGWMQSYENRDLRTLVEDIHKGRPVHALTQFRPVTWEGLASVVHSGVGWDDDKREWIVNGFGKSWAHFARDFLNTRSSQEYNALKHGSRPRMGGFRLSIGIQPDKGIPPLPDAIHPLGGSEFGSTFFISESVSGRLHQRPRRVSINWIPENMIMGLDMLAVSIQNVKSFLRTGNGTPPEECEYHAPTDPEEFLSPWAKHPGVESFNMDTAFGAADIVCWTAKQVVASLDSGDPLPSA